MNDLQPGMILEGAVTNVTNLVLLLILAYIRTAWFTSLHCEQVCGRSAYRGESGRYCEGEVLEVDLQRKRIALTMRLDESLAKPTLVAAAGMNVRKTTAGSQTAWA